MLSNLSPVETQECFAVGFSPIPPLFFAFHSPIPPAFHVLLEMSGKAVLHLHLNFPEALICLVFCVTPFNFSSTLFIAFVNSVFNCVSSVRMELSMNNKAVLWFYTAALYSRGGKTSSYLLGVCWHPGHATLEARA